MENASKALLMAGGILVAMLILSIGIYLFASYRDIGITYEQSLSAVEIEKFNSNFTKFEGRDDITIQEIVTLVNFAKQYKEQTEIDIQVLLLGEGNLTSKNDNDIIVLIQENSTENDGAIKYFECGLKLEIKDIEYDENGIVKSIKFN